MSKVAARVKLQSPGRHSANLEPVSVMSPARPPILVTGFSKSEKNVNYYNHESENDHECFCLT